MDEPLLRLELTGHAAVRATHPKTLEFAADAAITERATCVVGVAARGAPAAAFAGPVRFTVTVSDPAGGADLEAVVDAVANPDWRPGGTAVVRRSGDRRPDTLATEADGAAADLPRAMARAAADPAARLHVRCDRLARRPDGRAGLVLAWAAPTAAPGARLAAEVAAAGAVVAEDAGAMRLLAQLGVHAAAPRAADAGLLDGSLDRVLTVATDALPGVAVPGALARPDLVAVEVVGMPAALAAAAGSAVRGPVTLVGAVARGRIDAVLRGVPDGVGLAGTVAVADLARLFEVAAARRGAVTGAVVDPEAGGPVTWGPLARLGVARTGGTVAWVLDGAPPRPDGSADGLTGEVAALVAALLDDGVSARTVALALARLPGWSRRRGYAAVHELRPDDA